MRRAAWKHIDPIEAVKTPGHDGILRVWRAAVITMLAAVMIYTAATTATCRRLELSGQTSNQPQAQAMGAYSLLPRAFGGRPAFKQLNRGGEARFIFYDAARQRWVVASSLDTSATIDAMVHSSARWPQDVAFGDAWRVRNDADSGGHAFVRASLVRARCRQRLQERIERGDVMHSVSVHAMGRDADGADAADARMYRDGMLRSAAPARSIGAHLPSAIIIGIFALFAVCASWIDMVRQQTVEFTQQREDLEMIWTALGQAQQHSSHNVALESATWAQPPPH